MDLRGFHQGLRGVVSECRERPANETTLRMQGAGPPDSVWKKSSCPCPLPYPTTHPHSTHSCPEMHPRPGQPAPFLGTLINSGKARLSRGDVTDQSERLGKQNSNWGQSCPALKGRWTDTWVHRSAASPNCEPLWGRIWVLLTSSTKPRGAEKGSEDICH